MMTRDLNHIEQRQAYLWDLVKEVDGHRPRHYTVEEWASEKFVEEKIAIYEKLLTDMV